MDRLRLGIGKKISKLFFCIALGLHYLSIRQAVPRHWQKNQQAVFCIALGLHYLSIRQAAPRHWQKISKLFFCIALGLHYLCITEIDKTETMNKNPHNNAVLLMHCPDQPGILAVLTEFINTNGGNILYLDQYVDRVNGIFYMRVEWDLDKFIIPKEKINDYIFTLYAQRYNMEYSLSFTDRPQRMALFVSKMSHCLYDILARYTAGDWDVEIPLIISNHPDLETVGRQFDIPYFVIPVNRDNKAEMEAREFQLLDEYGIDFIVLARYMQVLSEDFINRYPNRIINIHHSFLPAFVGAKPYHAAYERGVKLIGATSHYVTTELDAGPIIEQDIVRITHKDTVADLIHKGRDLEKIVLSRAVEKHIQRKILSFRNKTIVFS